MHGKNVHFERRARRSLAGNNEGFDIISGSCVARYPTRLISSHSFEMHIVAQLYKVVACLLVKYQRDKFSTCLDNRTIHVLYESTIHIDILATWPWVRTNSITESIFVVLQITLFVSILVNKVFSLQNCTTTFISSGKILNCYWIGSKHLRNQTVVRNNIIRIVVKVLQN